MVPAGHVQVNVGFSDRYKLHNYTTTQTYMGGPDPVPDEFSFKYIKDRRTIFRRRR